MAGEMKDEAINTLLDGIKKKVAEVKEEHKWKELFVSTGDFFIENPDNQTNFENDLYTVFSSDNMRKLAEKLKRKKGYDFPVLLENELYNLLVVQYDISPDQAQVYIHHCIEIIVDYLEKNDSQKALEIHLGKWKRELDEKYSNLEKQLKAIADQITELKSHNITCYSISDIDIQIRRESLYKGMSLDFYEVDDDQFEEEFQGRLSDERIYVEGNSREETTRRILNCIQQTVNDRVTLIIKEESEWKRLQESGVTGKILVPYFYAEQIAAIPDNTNVFIYNTDEPCYIRDRLKLRRRTKKNIVHALTEIGIEYNQAYNMVENTHGLYQPLKKKLFSGAVHNAPEWVTNRSDVIVAALLCGKWTDAFGDKLIFGELAGKPYDECMKELDKYMHKENPFIVDNKGHHSKNKQLASVEDAWEELDDFISDEMWGKFTDLFYEVLIESEPIFEYPFEKHFEASIYAEKPDWSPALKKGMIRTLIMRAYYRNHEENQSQVDYIVSKVLNTIDTKEKWGYISQYLTDLCEASPKSVLEKLENEMRKPEGLMELFAGNDGDFITARNYYTNVLWAVEQLVQQKRYVVRAVDWLWKADSYNIKYSISNSPKSVLEVIFCAWLNESALSVDQKIEQARNAIEKYPNAWNIIASKLPNRSSSICSTLNSPVYRKVDEPEPLYTNDVRKTYIAYLDMCAGFAKQNAERWIKLLQHIDSYDKAIQTRIFDSMIGDCIQMSDVEKIKIKNKIRYKIYRHRRFCDADWSMPEDEVSQYEKFMNKIVIEDKVYEYLYIFVPKYEFPLLNPFPYKMDHDDLEERNEELREKEIKQKIDQFKRNKYSLDKLIYMVLKENDNTLGEVLAGYYCNEEFDEDVFDKLLKADKEGKSAFEYVGYLYRLGKADLGEIINRVKSHIDNKNLVANLIALQEIEDGQTALIFQQDDEIKNLYWKNHRCRVSGEIAHDTFIRLFGEIKKFGTLHTYLELLYDTSEKITDEELFDALLDATQIDPNGFGSMTQYYLEELLKRVQNRFVNDKEKCAQLVHLEWMFRNVLEWEDMRCTQKFMKDDPSFYAELVCILYRTDDNEPVDEERRKLANNVYEGFEKAKFCPAENDGYVIYQELKNWVTKFYDLLCRQNRQQRFESLIGRLLPYSPIGWDGYSPCEAVRKIIEEYDTGDLKRSYVITEESKRGVYTVDAGKPELEISDRYRKNAEGIREKYPKTAEIYYALSDAYKRQADYERRCAEDEW